MLQDRKYTKPNHYISNNYSVIENYHKILRAEEFCAQHSATFAQCAWDYFPRAKTFALYTVQDLAA